MLSVGCSRSWFPVVYMCERSVVGSGHRLWYLAPSRNGCVDFLSAGRRGPEVWGNRDQNQVEKKLAKILTGFDGRWHPQIRLDRVAHEPSKDAGQVPQCKTQILGSLLSAFCSWCYSCVPLPCILALPFLDTRGVKLSLLSLCALISLPPCQTVGSRPIIRAPIKENPL